MFSPYLKAYAALIGSMCTALLGVFTADSTAGKVLTVASILATTFVTFRVPNAPETMNVERDERGAVDIVIALLVAVLVLNVLIYAKLS